MTISRCEIDLDISACCDVCGGKLEITDVDTEFGEITVMVELCKECIQSVREEG